MLNKDQLVFFPADPDVGDNVGAYLRSATGDALTSTTVGGKEALDTRDVSVFAEDAGHSTGDLGQFILGVRNDANAALSGTDLDYTPIATDSAGRLKIVGTFSSNAEHAEDAAHVSGDIGSFSLAVRQDADAAMAADGDYTPFQTDSVGRLKVAAAVGGNVADGAADSGNPLKVGGRAVSGAVLANTGIANNDRVDFISDEYRRLYINDSAQIAIAADEVACSDTEAAVPTTALAGRRRMVIQNIGAKPVYIGATGVTDGDGLKINPSASLALELGSQVAVFAVCATGETANVRVLELA